MRLDSDVWHGVCTVVSEREISGYHGLLASGLPVSKTTPNAWM